MAKTPLDLFKTPGIDAKNVRLNEPQRDATRGNVAPVHKEKPLTKTSYVHGQDGDHPIERNYNFRQALEKEVNDKFEKDPNYLFSLSDLKKQYGDKPDYSWNTLPWNHIVKDGETYFYGKNAGNIDERIANYKKPWDQKALEGFEGYDWGENKGKAASILEKLRGRNNQFYNADSHIRRYLRDIKGNKTGLDESRFKDADDKTLLRSALLRASSDFDDARELPFTKQQWEQMFDEQWDDTNPKYRGGDPWDNVYDEIWDAYEREGYDGEFANPWRELRGAQWDDDYIYGDYGDDQEEGGEYYRPTYKFSAPVEESEINRNGNFRDWAKETGGDWKDYLEEAYYNFDTDEFDRRLDDILENAPTASSLAILNYLEGELGFDAQEKLGGLAWDTLYQDALSDLKYSHPYRYGTWEDEYNELENAYPWLDSGDIEDLLNDAGIYDPDLVREAVEDAIANSGGSYADIDDIINEVLSQFPELDSSIIEDYARDAGWTEFDEDDFIQWLTDAGANEENADRSLYDIIEDYGSGRVPEELYEIYARSLANPGGFNRPGYDNGLENYYGRDFAQWLNSGPKNIKNFYARKPEEYPNNVGDLIPEIDNASSWRDQIKAAKELVKTGKLSEQDAIHYLTSYTNLWQNGLLSDKHLRILEEEWGK